MPSKHANAGRLVQRGLYDNLRSFAELEQRISALGDQNTKIVGDAFEVFVEGYLATHQKMQAETVWLVGQIPPDIRLKLNLPNDAKGIDGVFGTRTGTLVPYQVKFRSQRAYLTYTEIAPFLGLTERATDRIVFTNSNELAEDVKNRDAMRTVRGIDFDDLTEDDFKLISCWLRERPAAIGKLTPRPYQIEALTRISETLGKSGRAHVVMACGTGKTLVALWAAEALKPKTVLVLVPSLTLLQQTLDEWSRHNSWGRDFTYLCVCSDPTVTAREANDPIHLDATDLDFRVDTSPEEVRRFIQSDGAGVKVVFATYHSSPVVSQGVSGLAPFDVAIFDEAHKTTGLQGGLFAHSLSDENVRIRKRLFFTATPRHYDIRHRDKEGDFRIVSMDDEAVYGPRAYTLTFGSAARQGIICNYKVVISVVDGKEINDFALKYGITLVKGDLIGARWVANQIAIERAIEKTGTKHAISFHSRVSSAKDFSSDNSHGIKQFLPDFSVSHVNGDQKSSERKQLIRAFRDAPKALITNARCLTEGIDVPAVDMVAFIDPRHSKIDIAQATGRAMRKPGRSDKEVGYVVVPLFLDRTTGETQEALERSDFADVVDVLNAMQEQDEDLVQIIRELQEAKGRGEVFDPSRLAERIEVLGPSIELSTLRSNIIAEVVETIGISWDEMFGRLVLFRDKHQHCRVPRSYADKKLALWVFTQRHLDNKGTLSTSRKERLHQIGFDWDPITTQWETGFKLLKAYVKEHRTCRVPALYKTSNGYQLGRWVSGQRLSQSTLSAERKARLDALGFDWNPFETEWKEGFEHLQEYARVHKHCNVLQKYKSPDGFKLGIWVGIQRTNHPSPQKKAKLDALGFDWDPVGTQWQNGFEHLREYVRIYKDCNVPALYRSPDDYALGTWVSFQRVLQEKLPSERRIQLDEIGFDWNPITTQWEDGFRHVQEYVKVHNDCHVPAHYKSPDGFNLGLWVTNNRKRRSSLSNERISRLDALGFDWKSRHDKWWDEGFEYLQEYVKAHKDCNVPQNYQSPDGYALGVWVNNNRGRRSSLSNERVERLDALGFVWGDILEAKWEEGFEHLRAYRNGHGNCRVPQKYKSPDGYKLGQWVSIQRSKQQCLSNVDNNWMHLDSSGKSRNQR